MMNAQQAMPPAPVAAAAIALGLAAAGCTGSPNVELSAARIVHAVTAELRVAVSEYHADLNRADDDREALAVRAFIDRLDEGIGGPAQLEQHRAALTEALARIRADRAVAAQRYLSALRNLDVLEETADGLRQHGTARLNLGRETLELLSLGE